MSYLMVCPWGVNYHSLNLNKMQANFDHEQNALHRTKHMKFGIWLLKRLCFDESKEESLYGRF